MTVVDNARLFAATLTANGALQAGRHNPVDGVRLRTNSRTRLTGRIDTRNNAMRTD